MQHTYSTSYATRLAVKIREINSQKHKKREKKIDCWRLSLPYEDEKIVYHPIMSPLLSNSTCMDRRRAILSLFTFS